jgi:hypothetical protein
VWAAVLWPRFLWYLLIGIWCSGALSGANFPVMLPVQIGFTVLVCYVLAWIGFAVSCTFRDSFRSYVGCIFVSFCVVYGVPLVLTGVIAIIDGRHVSRDAETLMVTCTWTCPVVPLGLLPLHFSVFGPRHDALSQYTTEFGRDLFLVGPCLTLVFWLVYYHWATQWGLNAFVRRTNRQGEKRNGSIVREPPAIGGS